MASSKKSNIGKPNKSAYIRKFPGLSAGDLVAKAKADGLVIQPGLVYAIRSADKGKTGGTKPAKATKGKTASVGGGLAGFDGAIRQIVREELRALLKSL